MQQWPKTKRNTPNLDWLVRHGCEEPIHKPLGAAGLGKVVVVEQHIVAVGTHSVVVGELHMVVAVDQAGYMLEEDQLGNRLERAVAAAAAADVVVVVVVDPHPSHLLLVQVQSHLLYGLTWFFFCEFFFFESKRRFSEQHKWHLYTGLEPEH